MSDCWYVFSDGLANDQALCVKYLEDRRKRGMSVPVIHSIGEWLRRAIDPATPSCDPILLATCACNPYSLRPLAATPSCLQPLLPAPSPTFEPFLNPTPVLRPLYYDD